MKKQIKVYYSRNYKLCLYHTTETMYQVVVIKSGFIIFAESWCTGTHSDSTVRKYAKHSYNVIRKKIMKRKFEGY